MFSRENRKNGVREGFEIVDISAAKVGCLAHVNQKEGPQVGKYRVNMQDLESIGVQASTTRGTERCGCH
jgi:nucleoside-triphosphatase